MTTVKSIFFLMRSYCLVLHEINIFLTREIVFSGFEVKVPNGIDDLLRGRSGLQHRRRRWPHSHRFRRFGFWKRFWNIPARIAGPQTHAEASQHPDFQLGISWRRKNLIRLLNDDFNFCSSNCVHEFRGYDADGGLYLPKSKFFC